MPVCSALDVDRLEDVRPGAMGYPMWHGSVPYMGGACLIPMHHVTSHVDLELVGMKRDHTSSTRDMLLGSNRSRVSCNYGRTARYKSA